MNSVYKWKLVVSGTTYYAYLLDDKNGGVENGGFIYNPENGTRNYGDGWVSNGMPNETAISRYTSYISDETTYLEKYTVLSTMVNDVLGAGTMSSDGTVFFNIDNSSCGDTGIGNGSCPVLTFEYETVGPDEEGGVVIKDSGVTNGVNWYVVKISVPKGDKGDDGAQGVPGENGTNGRDGEQGPAGPQGDQGAQGMAGKGRNVMAFKVVEKGSVDSLPTPTGGTYDCVHGTITYPEGWSGENTCSTAFTNGCDIWMSCGDCEPNSQSDILNLYNWTTPVKINGEDGDNGTDGDFIQFSYFNCEQEISNFDNVEEHYPDVYAGGHKIGEWTDHPTGISEISPIEYMTTRTRQDNTQEWGNWSQPVIWARWGEDGIDGDGVEYIFRVTTSKTETTATELKDEIDDLFNYLSGGTQEQQEGWNNPDVYNWKKNYNGEVGEWTDDPSDVSPTELYEWVSIRRSRNGVFDKFCTPKLWAKWASTPVVFDLSQENVGIGTGNDWVLDLRSAVTVSTILTATNAEIVNIEATPKDIVTGISVSADTGNNTIIVTLENGASFSMLEGHRYDVIINATARTEDNEEATGTTTFSITGVQGGKEGSVIRIETSVGSILNDLENGLFVPNSFDAKVVDGNSDEPVGVFEWTCTIVKPDTSITITDTGLIFAINDVSSIGIGDDVTMLRINAVSVDTNVMLYTDIPVLTTGKSSAYLQMDDDAFVIGTGTDDIVDLPEGEFITASTLTNLIYGNKVCNENLCYISNITVKHGDTEIGYFEYDGQWTGHTNDQQHWLFSVVQPTQGNGFVLRVNNVSIVKYITLEVRYGLSIDDTNKLIFSVQDGSNLAENFIFIITLKGQYGTVECDASAAYKIIGVRNGADGHSYQIKTNLDEFIINQDRTHYISPETTKLTVFESSREDVLLKNGTFAYTGYSVGNVSITKDTGNTVNVDTVLGETTIDLNNLNYVSGKAKTDLGRLYIKYLPTGNTPLFDTITLYVNEKNGNTPSADFIDDTWLILTGDDAIYDGSGQIQKTSILEVYYGAVRVEPSTVTKTSATVPHLSVSNYNSSTSAITFTAESGLNLETPIEVTFSVIGTGTDGVSYNVEAVFKIGGLKQGKDGEYYNLLVTPSFILKNEQGEYVNGYTAINTVGELVKGDTKQQLTPVANELLYHIFLSNGSSITGRTQTQTAFNAFTGYTNATLIQLEYFVNNEKVDEETIKINGAAESNPNILLGTTFNKGTDFVKQYWEGEHYGTATPRPAATYEVSDNENLMVLGEKSVVFYQNDGSFAPGNKKNMRYYDGMIYRKVTGVKPGTWYTLSFNVFSNVDTSSTFGNSPLTTHICCYNSSITGTSETIETSVFVDGVSKNLESGSRGRYLWNATMGTWDASGNCPMTLTKVLNGERHSFTFKTLSALTEGYITIVFRTYYTGKIAVSRIKLEEGKNATPYIANSVDNDGMSPILYTIDTSGVTEVKVNVAQNVIPQNLVLKLYKTVGDDKTIVTPVQNAVSFKAYDSSGAIIGNSGIGGPTIVSGSNEVALNLSGMVQSVETIEVTWKDVQTDAVLGMITFPVIRESLGKMLYSAGIWTAQAYSSTTSTAPFVYYTGSTPAKYYYLAADSASSGETPANSSKWVEMAQYQAILTDTLIANYAKIGSAVFFREFMFSQQGTSNPESSQYDYKEFLKDSSGNELSNHNVVSILSDSRFVPNYFVNFETGESYQKNAFVEGNITANVARFKNAIFYENRVEKLETNGLQLSLPSQASICPMYYSLNPPTGTLLPEGSHSYTYMTLPPASEELVGLEVRITLAIGSQSKSDLHYMLPVALVIPNGTNVWLPISRRYLTTTQSVLTTARFMAPLFRLDGGIPLPRQEWLKEVRLRCVAVPGFEQSSVYKWLLLNEYEFQTSHLTDDPNFAPTYSYENENWLE